MSDEQIVGIATDLSPGKAHTIGSGTEFHVDINFNHLYRAGKIDQIVELMDAKAHGYAEQGYRIEFSNEGVAGEIWNPDATPEQKEALAIRVIKAHDHSKNDSMDYYIVHESEKNRFSARGEDAGNRPFVLPVAEGWTIDYGTASNYGNFAIVRNEHGEEMYRIGHGDNTLPIPQDVTITAEDIGASPQRGDGATTTLNEDGSVTVAADEWLAAQENMPNQEEIDREVEEKGAENAFQSLMGPFLGGEDGQGMGGGGIGSFMIAMVFLAVASSAMKDMDEEEREQVGDLPSISEATHMDHEQLNDRLRTIDQIEQNRVQPSLEQSPTVPILPNDQVQIPLLHHPDIQPAPIPEVTQSSSTQHAANYSLHEGMPRIPSLSLGVSQIQLAETNEITSPLSTPANGLQMARAGTKDSVLDFS